MEREGRRGNETESDGRQWSEREWDWETEREGMRVTEREGVRVSESESERERLRVGGNKGETVSVFWKFFECDLQDTCDLQDGISLSLFFNFIVLCPIYYYNRSGFSLIWGVQTFLRSITQSLCIYNCKLCSGYLLFCQWNGSDYPNELIISVLFLACLQ